MIYALFYAFLKSLCFTFSSKNIYSLQFFSNPYPTSVRIVIGSHNKFSKTKFEVTRVAERIISYPDLEGDEVSFSTDFLILSFKK